VGRLSRRLGSGDHSILELRRQLDAGGGHR
jgi:hypothetical protein